MVAITGVPDVNFEMIEGDGVEEDIATFLIESLQYNRDLLTVYIDNQKGAEKAKAEKIRDQVDKYIEQIKKSKALGILGEILKFLAPLLMFVACLSALLCPNPGSIALLMVTAALFVDSVVGEATGSSLMQEGMKALGELLKDMGCSETVAAILTAVVLLALVAGGTALAAKGIGKFFTNSLTKLEAEGAKGFMARLKILMENGGLESPALRLAFEDVQSILMLMLASTQCSTAILKKQVADLLHACQLDQAEIDEWMKIIDLIEQDQTSRMTSVTSLEHQMDDFFDWTPKY